MISADLAALVEANAWTFGPAATALRILRLTQRSKAAPREFWEPLLQTCPRMAPLAYWRGAVEQGGWSLADVEQDFLRRSSLLAQHLFDRLGGASNILLVGHDLEIEGLWLRSGTNCAYRYLLLDGAEGTDSPGGFTSRRFRPRSVRLGPPFRFNQLEEALDWADAVVLAGLILHRQNVLGPPQLRPLLTSARDQVDAVLLCAVNERRLTLGDGAPRCYREDFRPYLWQSSVTHLVSEWHKGTEGTALGWLPLPPELLRAQFGEELFPS